MSSSISHTSFILWKSLITTLLLLTLIQTFTTHLTPYHPHHPSSSSFHLYVSAQLNGTVCTMKGNVTVGVMYSGSGALYSVYGKSALVVTRMYDQWVRQKPCGVGNSGVALNLIYVDVGGPTLAAQVALTQNKTTELINTYNASMIVAPEGSLAVEAGKIAAATKTTVVVGMSGARSTFINTAGKRAYPSVVGVMTPARNYFAPFMSLMRAQRYQTVAIVMINEATNMDTCVGALQWVRDNSMKVVYNSQPIPYNATAPIGSQADPANLTATLQQTKASGAQVLITCSSRVCDQLFSTIYGIDYSPLAHGSFECGNLMPSGSNLTWIAQYSYCPVQWDQRLFGQQYTEPFDRDYANMFPVYDDTSLPSPLQFFNAYQNASNNPTGVPITSLTSSHLAALYVVDYAIGSTGSNDRGTLFSAISACNIQSFFGILNFDQYGQNSLRQLQITQMSQANGKNNLVNPLVDQAIVPMPTFEERVFTDDNFRLPIVQVFLTISAIISVLLISLATFLYVHRKHPIVTAISVEFSECTVAACMMLNWSWLTWMPFNTDAACSARLPIMLGAFSLLLSSVSATVYRLHRIFNNKQMKIVKITRGKTAAFMLAAMSPALLLILIWSVQDLPQSQLFVVDNYRPSKNYTDCNNQYSAYTIVLILVCVYQLVLASYYSWMVKDIGAKFERFNSGKRIAFLVVGLVILAVVLAAMQLAVTSRASASDTSQFAMRTAIIIVVAFCTQILFFGDILVDVYKNKGTTGQDIKYGNGSDGIIAPQNYLAKYNPTERRNRSGSQPTIQHTGDKSTDSTLGDNKNGNGNAILAAALKNPAITPLTSPVARIGAASPSLTSKILR